MNIVNEKWDLLVILDACRYDYFEKIAKDYFEGNLKKVRSPASNTLEWTKKVFKEKYNDIIYISANPYINSKTEGREDQIGSFDAKKYFYKIVDVWDWGWSNKLGTVPPEEVNKAFHETFVRFPKKRFICHYMQPHAPYISSKKEKNKNNSLFSSFFENALGKMETRNKIRRTFNKIPIIDYRTVKYFFMILNHGRSGILSGYEENLRIVLEKVKNLANKFPGRVVITSDHGQFLGEKTKYGHPPFRNESEVRDVPWFQVNKVK